MIVEVWRQHKEDEKVEAVSLKVGRVAAGSTSSRQRAGHDGHSLTS